MALEFRYPTPLPSGKEWGPGWSSGDTSCSAIKTHIEPDPIFQGGVHARIHPLVHMLVNELEGNRYEFHQGWSWGFGCRGTKDSSGNIGGTPSFHSWGLALDFNAPLNSFGASRLVTQLGRPEFEWVVTLMHNWGFFWLGPAIGDWMHFSFCGTPSDADALTDRARKVGLGVMLTKEQAATIAQADAFLNALKAGTDAASFAGAGNRVAAATVKSEKGHGHATLKNVPPRANAGPIDHDHGKTAKE
jgi:hypothetical protein